MAATGTRDQYCPPAYIEYLKDVVAKEGKQNITFSIVEGCEHNVRKDSSQRWEGYIDLVFN